MLQMFATVLPAIGALAAVLALILLAGRASRLMGFARGSPSRRASARSQRLMLQDTLAIDRMRRLHVIKCDDRELILLTGGTTDLVVGWTRIGGDSA